MAQKLTNTAPNRYPGIFRTIRARIAETRGADLGGGGLRILSFGCSAGFEMLSLRSYFPDATIFGCDRSVDALDRAKRNLREDAGIVFYSTPEAVEAFGPYDVILAMSVLCQYPASSKVERLDTLFPFSTFAALAGQLVRVLRPGGLISIFNANYLVSALPEAGLLAPVRSPLIHTNGFIDKFAPDGTRLTRSFRDKATIAQKAVAAGVTDDDLRDCLYEKGTPGAPIAVDFLPACVAGEVDFGPQRLVAGIAAESALESGVVASGRVERAGQAADGRYVIESEWRKTRLDGTVEGFGTWQAIGSAERAGVLKEAQQAALAVTAARTRRSDVLMERLRSRLPF